MLVRVLHSLLITLVFVQSWSFPSSQTAGTPHQPGGSSPLPSAVILGGFQGGGVIGFLEIFSFPFCSSAATSTCSLTVALRVSPSGVLFSGLVIQWLP